MLQEVIDEYIASLSLNEQGRGGTNQNTVVAYQSDLKQASSYLKRQHIEYWQEVTHDHIEGYLLEMRNAQAYRPATRTTSAPDSTALLQTHPNNSDSGLSPA